MAEIRYEEENIVSIEEKVIEKMLESDEIMKEIRESEAEFNKISDKYNIDIKVLNSTLEQNESKLEKLEKEKRLKMIPALSIMAQIAEALKSIHSLNIIHRDLKPENIMLIEKEGNPNFVKLLDFGLATAQHLSRLTQTGNIVGTIYYLSPEQIGGKSLGPASDIHALGVIYYEMLTGYKPFMGETSIDIMKQILIRQPIDPVKLRPEINKGLCDLVMFMLHKDPALRPEISTIDSILQSMMAHTIKPA